MSNNKKTEDVNAPSEAGSFKQLLLVRHAKSSWNDLSQKDFDRPLNERGEKDAPDMAKRLAKKNISIDAFVSSPAKRAFSTARHFAKAFGVKKKKIIQVQGLYEASVNDFYSALQDVDDKFDTIAIFSHNPGITAFANSLTDVHVDDMPTCGIFAVRINVGEWKNFKDGEKQFWFFDYPKNIS
jgi:phosphohistidine phosphatase